ncbi:DUF2062 domain-containing protein [Paraglaciecola marina]|uniref:DUF2062 domain-containing protein n=1 Tax=Paraglaciecola marina TaxID=2500157 RepID=UPI001414D030|nr:DUF2062 domain-containing protein [Paraglaciecola marina]
MLKKFIKRFLPSPQKIKEHKVLSIFGTLLHDPNLWHLNRRSAAGAVAVGLFFAFIPLPFQMWLSAGMAIPLRVNLPLSVATVWITNPFTMPPIFYGAYLIGATALGTTTQEFTFELSWHWVMQSMETIGPAFLVGCLICSVFFSTVGYFTFNYFWRLSVSNAWQQRKRKKKRDSEGL